MNENIKSCLKEWYKWTKFLYKNGQKKKDKQKLETQGAYWTEQIMKAKNDYTLKITDSTILARSQNMLVSIK